MKINIYYGGRGMIDDPTLYVISKMTKVFKELNVEVAQYNFYEQKNNIPALQNTLKQADGIVLAATVEWFGVGGYLMQFLDACYLYGNKEKISRLYMLPVVMSTTYGERDGMTYLSSAWEIIGGMPCEGICGYIAQTAELEKNASYNGLIEKKAENFYRTINQKLPGLPNSNQAVKTSVSLTKGIDLTPQESEQLSQYVSDDSFVQKQKEDIEELTNIFRSRMGQDAVSDATEEYLQKFKSHFYPQHGIQAKYRIAVTDDAQIKPMLLEISARECRCGTAGDADTESGGVSIGMKKEVLDAILAGQMTFQRAFMAGDMKMKGEFKLLRNLDQLFSFMEKNGG